MAFTAFLTYGSKFIHPETNAAGVIPQHTILVNTENGAELQIGQNFICKRLTVDEIIPDVAITFRIICSMRDPHWNNRDINQRTVRYYCTAAITRDRQRAGFCDLARNPGSGS